MTSLTTPSTSVVADGIGLSGGAVVSDDAGLTRWSDVASASASPASLKGSTHRLLNCVMAPIAAIRSENTKTESEREKGAHAVAFFNTSTSKIRLPFPFPVSN